MNLFFNELSLNPIAENKRVAIDRMELFSKAVSAARNKGFRNIKSDYFTNQIELSQDYTLYNWLNDSDVKREQREFLFGVLTHPYINDDDTDIIEEFVETAFTFTSSENNISRTSCIGLASAYLYDSPAISLRSLPVWNDVKLKISVIKNGLLNENLVYNVSSVESFNDEDLIAYIDKISELILDKSTINPRDKSVTLSGDHHGKREIKKLSDKLINSPYVIEIRSTNFGGNRFIRKINGSGIVEITLMDTDSRYALRVQTTGRNLRETKAIAQILENDFS